MVYTYLYSDISSIFLIYCLFLLCYCRVFILLCLFRSVFVLFGIGVRVRVGVGGIYWEGLFAIRVVIVCLRESLFFRSDFLVFFLVFLSSFVSVCICGLHPVSLNQDNSAKLMSSAICSKLIIVVQQL